jgi:predicted P-loop ATPase
MRNTFPWSSLAALVPDLLVLAPGGAASNRCSQGAEGAAVSAAPDTLGIFLSRWRDGLAPSGKDSYLGDERNILIALREAPELAGLLRFNEFSLETELTGKAPWHSTRVTHWSEADDTQLTAWLQAAGIRVRSRGAVADTVAVVARQHAYHPVRDHLQALKWDGEKRLQIWLAEYLNAIAPPDYLAAVGTRFLISAVARIMDPGCQADHMLVLEGAQGIGKTSAARALAKRPEWFAGNLPDIHSTDAALQLAGRWIVEIAELKAIRNSQVEATKTFITETRDTFRPPYGRRTAQFPRQCVFIATTNESEYLRDRSGNRRYWPVRCTKVDVAALTRDCDQLYAEAVQLYRQGVAWHLTDDEIRLALAQQQDRVHITELEQDVLSYLDTVKGDEVTVREVLHFGLHLETDKPTYAETARKLGPAVAEALERCGWRKVARVGKAENRRTLYRRYQG